MTGKALKDEIHRIVEEAEHKARENAKARAEWQQRAEEQRLALRSFLRKCRRATVEDYADWLYGFISRGGQITHLYSYNLPSSVFVLIADAELPELYGAAAISVIVPVGCNLTVAGPGHSEVFYMDGFTAVGSVPCHTDVLQMLQLMAETEIETP